MENMLNDKNTYTKISKEPTKKLTNEIRETLTRWKKNKYIALTRVFTAAMGTFRTLMDFRKSTSRA